MMHRPSLRFLVVRSVAYGTLRRLAHPVELPPNRVRMLEALQSSLAVKALTNPWCWSVVSALVP